MPTEAPPAQVATPAAPAAPTAPSRQAHAEGLMAAARQTSPDVAKANPAPQAQPQKAAAKPAQETAAKPEPKKGVERIPTLEEPAAPKPDDAQVTETQQGPDDEITKQKTWDKYKNSHKWREQIEPEYQTLKQKEAEWTTKQDEFQKTQKELEDHRQFRAAYDWQNSDAYKDKVAKPMAKEWKNAAEVADYLGADRMKLETAMLEPNPLKRDEMIEAVLMDSGKEVKPSALQRVCDAATRLAEINETADGMEREALDLQSAMKGRQDQETAKQKAEREAQWTKASTEIANAFKAKFGPLIAKNPEIAKALAEARIAEDPMDQAMQAQSAEMLPIVTNRLIEALKENAELKKHRKAVQEAGPKLGSERTQSDQQPTHKDHTSALQAAAAEHYGRRF